MKKLLTIFIFLIVGFFSLNNNIFAFTGSNGLNVNLLVEGCNLNGICEFGENLSNCPSDCTPPPPPPPPPGGGNNGAGMLPGEIFINNLSIEPDFTSSTIYWSSSVGTRSTLRYGETAEVKEGTLRSVVFAMIHKVEIINLKPGTMYFFTIQSESGNGKNSIYGPIYFFTKFLKDTTYPLSPLNVKAVATIPGIIISWQNPPDNNFSYIRIMKHEDRFRGDPFLGKLIYEGSLEKFLDKDVVSGKKYFYVLFSRDNLGNFSTGTGISQNAYSSKKVIIPIIQIPPTVSVPETFFVHQYNQTIEPLTEHKMISINNRKSTIVDTKVKTFPDDIVRVTDEEGKVVGEYLFSFSKDSNRYQSVVPPLTKEGLYNIKIYRYINNKSTLISEGSFNSKETIVPPIQQFYQDFSIYYYILIFIFVFLLFLVVFYLRHNKNSQ